MIHSVEFWDTMKGITGYLLVMGFIWVILWVIDHGWVRWMKKMAFGGGGTVSDAPLGHTAHFGYRRQYLGEGQIESEFRRGELVLPSGLLWVCPVCGTTGPRR